ncbi:MAG: tetratricopeptide repeat protein [Gemmatimonadetes bacterium]|nr:MAG: tetratricopeptide repeat protein [Gemmatimonadota bacterium]
MKRIAGRVIVIVMMFTQSALGLTGEEIKTAYERSYTYEKIQDYQNAIKAMLAVFNAYPEGYTVNVRLGWLYYLNQNYANAIDHYQKAMKTAPYAAEAKLGYLLPLLAQGKYSEVEKIAYQILTIDYYNYYANLRLALALRMQEKYDLAQTVVERMLLLYPTDVPFLVEQALVKQAQDDPEAATAIFWDVLILDPENVTAKMYFQQMDAPE